MDRIEGLRDRTVAYEGIGRSNLSSKSIASNKKSEPVNARSRLYRSIRSEKISIKRLLE